MAASLKASSLYRSWRNGDSMDSSDAERLFDADTSSITKPVSCRSYWTVYVGLILFLALFLFGIVVGFYLRADTKVPDGCSKLMKRSDGFDEERVQAVHNNIMHFMSKGKALEHYRPEVWACALPGLWKSNVRLVCLDISLGGQDFPLYLSVDKHLSGFAASGPSVDVDRLSAQYVAGEFRKYGFHQVELQEHEVVVTSPDPKHPNRLEVLQTDGSSKLNVTINRHGSGGMSGGRAERHELPPINSSKTSQVVHGRVVYGNHGSHIDLLKLRSANISVQGTILLLRLGRGSVEELVDRARLAGAVGVMLYCDQTSEGVCSYGDLDDLMTSVSGFTDKTTPTIPVQTVSYPIAMQLLGNMSTTSLLNEWTPLVKSKSRETIHGNEDGGDINVRLHWNSIQQRKKVYNVVGTLSGGEQKDRVIMVGSERQIGSMVQAQGPADIGRGMKYGTAFLLELARSLGYMHQHQGWNPRRSVRLCSWGEPLHPDVGQKLYIKANKHILSQEVVSYINLDLQSTGSDVIHIESSPALHRMISIATAMVPDPFNPELALADNWPAPPQDNLWYNQNHVQVYSGCTIWQQLGIPTIDIQLLQGQRSETQLQKLSKDHSIKNSLAAARVVSLMTLRLVDDLRLPFSVQLYTDYIRHSLTSSLDMLNKMVGPSDAKIEHLVETIHRLITFSNISSGSTEACLSMVQLQHDNDLLMRLDSIFMDVFLNHSSKCYVFAQDTKTGTLSSFLEASQLYLITKDIDTVYNFLETVTNLLEQAVQEMILLHHR